MSAKDISLLPLGAMKATRADEEIGDSVIFFPSNGQISLYILMLFTSRCCFVVCRSKPLQGILCSLRFNRLSSIFKFQSGLVLRSWTENPKTRKNFPLLSGFTVWTPRKLYLSKAKLIKFNVHPTELEFDTLLFTFLFDGSLSVLWVFSYWEHNWKKT